MDDDSEKEKKEDTGGGMPKTLSNFMTLSHPE